jgi:hypothetical protein
MVLRKLPLLAAVSLTGAGCGSVHDQFVGTRTEDACDGTWPVCSTQVGCLLGDTSYISGRFPGKNQVAYQLFEPSTVTVTFFLTDIAGAGEQTTLNFYEGSCRSRVTVDLTGKVLISESTQAGQVSRSADLSDKGDHLLEIESDARLNYLLKLDVLPLRLKDSAN